MKKLFMFLFMVIVFFLGFVSCPSPNDPAPKAATTIVAKKPSTGVDIFNEDSAFPVPEPLTLVMVGSGLIGLAVIGRKSFRK